MVKLAGIVSPSSNHFSLWLILSINFTSSTSVDTGIGGLVPYPWFYEGRELPVVSKCWARAMVLLSQPSVPFPRGRNEDWQNTWLLSFRLWHWGLDLDNQLAHLDYRPALYQQFCGILERQFFSRCRGCCWSRAVT